MTNCSFFPLEIMTPGSFFPQEIMTLIPQEIMTLGSFFTWVNNDIWVIFSPGNWVIFSRVFTSTCFGAQRRHFDVVLRALRRNVYVVLRA